MEKEFEFHFNMLYHDFVLAKEKSYCEEDSSCEKTYDYKLNEYELNKVYLYIVNSLIITYNTYENSLSNLIKIIEKITNEYSIFNKYSNEIEEVENEISKMPYMQNLLKQSKIKSKQTNDIEYKECLKNIMMKHMFKDKTTVSLIKKLIKNILNKELKYLKNKNNLKKAFYTENLEFILNKMHITNKKIKNLAELSLYCFLSSFRTLSPYNLDIRGGIWKNCSKLLGKEYQLQDILPYAYRLFMFDTNLNIGGQIDFFSLKDDILCACFNKYKNQEDCMDLLINKASKEDLIEDDFKHIKQYDYIKDLLKNALKNHTKGINILLYGKPGTGKSAMAKVLMQNLTNDRYEVMTNTNKDFNRCNRISDSGRLTDLRITNYFTMLSILGHARNSIILYDEAEDFFRKNLNADQSKAIYNTALENNAVPTIWTTNDLYCIEPSFLRRFTYILNIDNMSKNTYKKIIDRILDKKNILLPEDIIELLLKYRPNIGVTEKLISNYKNNSIKSYDSFKQDLFDTLKGINRGEAVTKLAINSFKFNPDLINADIDLKALTNNIKQSGRLDFSLLLYGVPGSSKTSYGRYLAEELGLDVINKSYTELSSMWVGETEKNITKLFEQAEAEKALIILDECDVLLRDRNSARVSWEISQTEALLTAMEFHPYPFIMTTNLFEHLDPAVMRRILYKVQFNYLKPEQINTAFKHFFELDIKENLHLSRLTSGDFAVIKKQAEFQNKLHDKDWLINKLTKEMEQKKYSDYISIKL